ncbi:MAG: ABC transporter ATP-binding protein, partial [Bacteroidetes bacterium]|nr:ABC transporter ATP-binding protein [Bacteroidota bacterium]
AGKTTLVEMLEGLQSPDSGTIEINGLQWKGNADELHRQIGLSLQETRFIDKLTTRETLSLFASFYGLSNERVYEILDIINLKDKETSWVVKLSGGQRQKLALGIALLNSPKILLLDEPTTGLDPTARREIWKILLKLKKDHNTTLILTTHYMDEADFLCERIIIMDKGKILAKGTLEELLSQNKEGEVIEFSLQEDIRRFKIGEGNGTIKYFVEEKENKGKLIVDDIVESLPGFLQSVKEQQLVLRSLECRKMTLDDLFISMTGRHLDEETEA